jgi:hypothetical protein
MSKGEPSILFPGNDAPFEARMLGAFWLAVTMPVWLPLFFIAMFALWLAIGFFIMLTCVASFCLPFMVLFGTIKEED